MLAIINDPSLSEARRDKFIIAAAPYLDAQLTSIVMAKAPFEIEGRALSLFPEDRVEDC